MSFFLASSDEKKVENYFNGMAFSDDSIVLSLDGLESYLSESKSVFDLIDGRYTLSCNINGSRLFTTDRTGQDCWFYYSDNNFWVVSNSLYAVAEKLKEKNKKIYLNESGFLFYNIDHSLGDQPCSENTMVKGVKILPKDNYIEVSNNGFKVLEHRVVKEIKNNDEYIEELLKYVGKWQKRLTILSRLVEDSSVRCDVSGGIDSRIVMGLTNPQAKNSRIKYSSNKAWKSDFFIASLLCKKYSRDVDNSEISSSRSISADTALSLYKYGNAGTYKNIYWPKQTKAFPAIHLHGAGGGNVRGVGSGSAWKVVHRLKNHFPDLNSYEAFKREYLGWFKKNDVDFKSENSTIIHYRNFRGRFHFGRNWFRSLTNPLITPLSSVSLEVMADYISKSGRDAKSLQFDMLYLCDEFLPFFPFDSESKKFTQGIINDSFKYVVGLKSKIYETDINTYGNFSSCQTIESSGVLDIEISQAARLEVDDFLQNSDSKMLHLMSGFTDDKVDKLNAYSAIAILKLI